MPKAFFTERDIEDLAERGISSLELNDDVVVTELARDKARLLGVALVRPGKKAAPAAPPAASASPAPAESALHQRIRAAVLAKMGGQLDPALVDRIIQRVLAATGVK